MENLVTIILAGSTGETAELSANQEGTVMQAILEHNIMENSDEFDVMWNKEIVNNQPIKSMAGKTLTIAPKIGDGGVAFS